MKTGDVPTVADLKCAALSDSTSTVLQLVLSDVIIVQALASAGQAVRDLREQVELLKGFQDEVAVAVLAAHSDAESLLQKCAEAAHLAIKRVMDNHARRAVAGLN